MSINSDFKVGDIVKVGGRRPYIGKVVRSEDGMGRMRVAVVHIAERTTIREHNVHVDDCVKVEVDQS